MDLAMDPTSADDRNSAEVAYENDPLVDKRDPLVDKREDSVSILSEEDGIFAVRTYPVRWFVLATFFFLAVINNAIWITFSPIAIIAECYYGISLAWVNALSTASMITFVVTVLPIAWFVGRYGVRATIIFGCCLNAAGAWLRFAAVGK